MISIQKWGNSQGIRLPKQMLQDSGLKEGDFLRCSIQKGAIVLKPIRKKKASPKKYRLKDLLEQIPYSFKNKEVSWGKPKGKEAW